MHGVCDHRTDLVTSLCPCLWLLVDLNISRERRRGDSRGQHTAPCAAQPISIGAQRDSSLGTTVISAAKTGYVTTDAGLKAFSTGSGDPVIASGGPQGATYAFMGDEHGRITFAKKGQGMALGDQVECITPHCDPTIALYDCYHVVRGDTLVDIWPVDCRGHW